MRPSAEGARRAAMQRARQRGQEGDTGRMLEELREEAEGVRTAGASRLREEQADRREWREPEYWFAVAFESRAQKLAVLAALGLPVHEDKYISGTDLIRALKLPVPELERPRHRMKSGKVWEEFCD